MGSSPPPSGRCATNRSGSSKADMSSTASARTMSRTSPATRSIRLLIGAGAPILLPLARRGPRGGDRASLAGRSRGIARDLLGVEDHVQVARRPAGRRQQRGRLRRGAGSRGSRRGRASARRGRPRPARSSHASSSVSSHASSASHSTAQAADEGRRGGEGLALGSRRARPPRRRRRGPAASAGGHPAGGRGWRRGRGRPPPRSRPRSRRGRRPAAARIFRVPQRS